MATAATADTAPLAPPGKQDGAGGKFNGALGAGEVLAAGFGGGGGGGGEGIGGNGGFGGGGGAGYVQLMYSKTPDQYGQRPAIGYRTTGLGPDYGAGGFGAGHGDTFGGGMGAGGAIFNDGGVLTVINSTLTGNTATGGNQYNRDATNYPSYVYSFPMIRAIGAGGAVFARNGSVTLRNCTLGANTAIGGFNEAVISPQYSYTGAGAGGAMYLLADGDPVYITSAYGGNQPNGPTVRLSATTAGYMVFSVVNTIFSGSTGSPSDVYVNSINGGTVAPDSVNFSNLVHANATGGNALPGVSDTSDPMLGLLQYNGGLTPTLAPGRNSSVTGEGNATYATPSDQRGVAWNGVVDIGAFKTGQYALGTLQFEGIVSTAPNQNVTAVVHPTDNSGDLLYGFAVPAAGTFGLYGLPAKPLTIHIKGSKWLAASLALDLTNGSYAGLRVKQPAGDANNDNSVDATDFGLLVGAFNGDSSVPGSGYDPLADFNCDGVVDTTDFGLLVGEYNNTGAN